MKTFSVSLVLAAGIAVSSTAFAQIPVTDGASIANSIQQC
jgi:type IV secretion system protein VirB5